MDIKPSGSRPSMKAPAEYFTGAVRQDPLMQAPAPASVQVVTATSKIGFSSQGATVVHVAAGHTVVTKIKPPRGGKSADFAVQVTPLPGSGPVYVGRVIQAGGVVRSILPIVSALSWVPLPPTEDSLSVGGTGR